METQTMQVIMLTYAVLLLMISPSLGGHVKGHPSHGKIQLNSPNVSEDRIFLPEFGTIFDIFEVDGIVRNLLAPMDENFRNYLNSSFSDEFQPTLYFNIHNEDGENQGLYVLKDGKMSKINDGRDSVADYPRWNDIDKHIYIATADGIYTYDPSTEDVQKYGTLTDDVIGIDKLSGTDLIYILCADHKIYKVTNRGTKKDLVTGVDYAKDFVLDFTGSIHYIGQDNKPRFLLNDVTEPYLYEEFDFDDVDLIFGRPVYSPFSEEGGQSGKDYTVLLIINGELSIVTDERINLYSEAHKVPDITAFSAEYSFFNYYGAGAKIYFQNLITESIRKSEDTKQSPKTKVSRKVIAYDRDVKADYEKIKSFH